MDDLKAIAAHRYLFASYLDKGIQACTKLYSNIRWTPYTPAILDLESAISSLKVTVTPVRVAIQLQ